MKLLKQLVTNYTFSAYAGGVIINSYGDVEGTEQRINLSMGFPPYLSVEDGVYTPEYDILTVLKNGVILKMSTVPGGYIRKDYTLRVTGLQSQTCEFNRVCGTRFLTCQLDEGVSCVLRTPSYGNTGYNPVVELTINDVEFLIYLKTPVSSVDMKASVCVEGEGIYLLVNGEKVDIPSPLTQNQSPRHMFQPSPFPWVGSPHQQHNPPQAEYVNIMPLIN